MVTIIIRILPKKYAKQKMHLLYYCEIGTHMHTQVHTCTLHDKNVWCNALYLLHKWIDGH